MAESRTDQLGVATPEKLAQGLSSVDYLADLKIATASFLALALEKPLLLEGDAGVGKTELALALSRLFGSDLIRLQCYEGIDATQAVYDWDYAKQLLHLRATEAVGVQADRTSLEAELYEDRYLIERPLLRSLGYADPTRPPVLLIDELDRADDEFEAFLLELLSTFEITIPELGTRRALVKPVVILTSNRTRDLHDALKRRCLYLWVDHPSFEREVEIIRLRVPEASASLAAQIGAIVQEFRRQGLVKPPGIAEAIDWASALTRLTAVEVTPAWLEMTLGTVIKYREDEERIDSVGLTTLIERAFARFGA
ncbi:MoxR family ATPase [Ferrimicrobium sp.]|uniref:AAA family ATPase n=1 Tax=Ferrimicrobium sp. TaxID=2926050 RepID=UPI00261026FE|nr:MoxR family ATPase [Ferrimicrobium sp.]